jgi:hypothetical protein
MVRPDPESLVVRGQARLFGVAGSNPPASVITPLSGSNVKGSCPESLVVRGPARLFGVVGSNPPASMRVLRCPTVLSPFP